MSRVMPESYRALYINRKDERAVEYPWVWENLTSSGRILDVGCGESGVCDELAKLGCYEVYGIDIRDVKPKGWIFIKADIRRTNFPCGFFDQIVCISTLEHIGMKAYGNNWIDEINGDRMALLEMNRVLKVGGSMLITVPYGSKGDYWVRFYNRHTLKGLLEGFNWKAEYVKYVNGEWKPCSPSADVLPPRTGGLPNAVALIKVIKDG